MNLMLMVGLALMMVVVIIYYPLLAPTTNALIYPITPHNSDDAPSSPQQTPVDNSICCAQFGEGQEWGDERK